MVWIIHEAEKLKIGLNWCNSRYLILQLPFFFSKYEEWKDFETKKIRQELRMLWIQILLDWKIKSWEFHWAFKPIEG